MKKDKEQVEEKKSNEKSNEKSDEISIEELEKVSAGVIKLDRKRMGG